MVLGGELEIANAAVGWLAGRLLDYVADELVDDRKKISAEVSQAVEAAVTVAAQRVGRPGAAVLADDLVKRLGESVVKSIVRRREPIDGSPTVESFQREFVSRYPETADEGISPFTQSEAREFLTEFVKALRDHLWRSDVLEPKLQSAALRRIDSRVESLLPETDINKIVAKSFIAASADLDRHREFLGEPKCFIERIAIYRDSSAESVVSIPDLIEEISSNWRSTLVADPGAGKTTWLLRLASAVVDVERQFVPFFVPIDEIAGEKDTFHAITRRAAFVENELNENELRRLAGAGRALLIFDGWNELSSTEQRNAERELVSLARNYPSIALIVATRPSTSSASVSEATRVSLAPLSRAQQVEYMRQVRGDDGVEALRRVQANIAFAETFSTPLFLELFGELSYEEELPQTRGELIGKFIAIQQGKRKHKEPLDRFFSETQMHFLQRIAIALTDRGVTQAPGEQLNPVVVDTASELQVAKRISVAPEPLEALELLSSHTSLCCDTEAGKRVYRFQHQQFQEWFASLYVDEQIIRARASSSSPPSDVATNVVDVFSWEEAILFSIERQSTLGDGDLPAATRVVLETLGIDPLFAAQMIARGGEHLWATVKDSVEAFLMEWEAETDRANLLLFAFSSGRPEFEEVAWEYLSESEKYDEVTIRLHTGFNPAVLGENFVDRSLRLDGQNRKNLVWDLGFYGGDLGVQMALEISYAAASEEVVDAMAYVLIYRQQFDRLEEFLNKVGIASDRLVMSLDSRDMPSEGLKELHKNAVEGLLEKSDDPMTRARCAVKLLDYGDESFVDDAIQGLMQLDSSEVRWSVHGLLQSFYEVRPDSVASALLERMKSGKPLFYGAEEFLKDFDDQAQANLIELIEGDPNQLRSISSLASGLSKDSVEKLVEIYVSFGQQLNKSGGGDSNERERLSHYRTLIHNCDLSHLIQVVCQPDCRYEPSDCVELLSRWGSYDDVDRAAKLEAETRALLTSAVGRWQQLLLEAAGVSRGELASLAGLIGKCGLKEMLPELKRLLDKELDAHDAELKEEEEAIQKGERPDGRARMYYDNLFARALSLLRCEQTKEFLVGYLDDPRFAISAADCLVSYCPHPVTSLVPSSVGRDFEPKLIRARRISRESLGMSNSPGEIPAKVVSLIEKLIELGDEGSVASARRLACRLAQMDYGDRKDVFDAVLAAPGSARSNSKLIHNLFLVGEQVDSSYIEAGLAEAEAEYFSKEWRSDNEFWMLSDWLELVAASDNPVLFAERWESYRDSVKRHYSLRNLIRFIELAPSGEAIEALLKIAEISPEVGERYEWLTTVSRIDSEKAAGIILEALLSGSGEASFMHSHSEPVQGLVYRARGSQEFQQQLLDDYEQAPPDKQRKLGMLLYHSANEELFIEIVNRMTGAADCPLFKLGGEIVEGLCRQHVPIDGSVNAYEIVGRPVGPIRERLFDLANDCAEKRANLDRLLQLIDSCIADLPRVDGSSRHPKISSQLPWPRSANALWKGMCGQGV